MPIKGIGSCGIEALSNLAPHLEQLHMLALWGRLWSRLGFRFWNECRLPVPWDKTAINSIFGEVKLALKDMAEAPNPSARFGPHMFTGGPDVSNSYARSGNMSHG